MTKKRKYLHSGPWSSSIALAWNCKLILWVCSNFCWRNEQVILGLQHNLQGPCQSATRYIVIRQSFNYKMNNLNNMNLVLCCFSTARIWITCFMFQLFSCGSWQQSLWWHFFFTCLTSYLFAVHRHSTLDGSRSYSGKSVWRKGINLLILGFLF